VLKNSENLEKLEGALGYSFHDRALLQLALTHTSYANEHKEEGAGDNERLEFLGGRGPGDNLFGISLPQASREK
jgi:dsRNA-specific ribonuclease